MTTLAPASATRPLRRLHAAGPAAPAQPVQQLPFRARAALYVSNSLLYPVAGAALGALLLGVPGAILGGVAGWMLVRR